MHPTGPEQLQAVQRQLAELAADDGLRPEQRAVLVDAARVLDRLAAAWPARLAFLLADNEATARLLAELGAAVPPDPPPLAPPPFDRGHGAGPEEAAHARNKALRAALAELVAGLPPPPEADDVRRRVARHLRMRLAADPSLQRRPQPYGVEPEPDGAS